MQYNIYNTIQYLEACGLEDADDIGSEPDAGLAVVPVRYPALGAEPVQTNIVKPSIIK